MANLVRFYDADIVDPGTGNYNDGSVADGTVGKGRFVLTVDPFAAPAGTDGQFFELDFVVDDPSDAAYVFWGWVGVDVAVAPAIVTGGFTFDAAAPSGFDYWGCFRDTKVDYDTYVAGNLVAGATNYARNNATFYDGAYQIQGLGFVVGVDPASVDEWWLTPQPPVAPTITAPAAGPISYGTDTVTVTLVWNAVADADHYQVEDGSGGYIIFEAGLSHNFVYSFPSRAVRRLKVRAVNDFGTSGWSTVVITLAPDLDAPVTCIDDEALADSPDLLWLFREASGVTVEDLSGNGHDGTFRPGTVQHHQGGAGGATFTTTTQVFSGDRYAERVVVWLWLRHDEAFSDGYSTPPAATLPAGWTRLERVTFTDADGRPASLECLTAVGLDVTDTSQWTFTLPFAHWIASYRIARYLPSLEVMEHGATLGSSPITIADLGWPGWRIQTSGAPGVTSFFGGDDSIDAYAGPSSRTLAGTFDIAVITVQLGFPGQQTPELGYDSLVCDSACEDTTGAVAFGAEFDPGSDSVLADTALNNDRYANVTATGYTPLDSGSDWTYEIAFSFGPDVDLGLDLDHVARATVASSMSQFLPTLFVGYGSGLEYAPADALPKTECVWHVALVNDTTAGEGRLYVNGLLRASNSFVTPGTSDEFSVGAWGPWDDVFPAVLFHLAAVYPTVLTPTRIYAHARHFACHRCTSGRGLVLGSLTLN